VRAGNVSLKLEADVVIPRAQGSKAEEVITIDSDNEDDSRPLTPPDSTDDGSPHSPHQVEGAQPVSTSEDVPFSSCPEEARSASRETTSNLQETKTVSSPAPPSVLRLASPKAAANPGNASSHDDNDLRPALRQGNASKAGPAEPKATQIEESTDDDNDLAAAIRATKSKVAPTPRVPPRSKYFEKFSDDVFRIALEKNYTRIVIGKQEETIDLDQARKRAAPAIPPKR
jgi:hypothetical protein